MPKLQNKVVLITGASMGIGEAIARLFATEGAKLALAARSLDKLQALSRELPTETIAICADMMKPEEIREMIEATVERFGRIDILINNAGVGLYSAFAEAPIEHIEHLVATNWLGPMHAIHGVIPHMRKQGSGQIINIASVAGKIAIPWMSVYCSTKFALNALSYGLRMELEEHNIQVISICPGRIKTPFTENAFKGTRMPLRGGCISAERVARAVLRASLNNSREIIVPVSNWLYVLLHGLLPRVTEWCMVRVLRWGMEMQKRSR